MNCMFIGHQTASDEIKKPLKDAILYLIRTEQIKNFFVGNNGNFDFYVQCALRELKNEVRSICFSIVLSRLDEKALSENQGETIFPEGLENSLPKFAIAKRNDWLIKNSSFVIAYVTNQFSNSYKWMQKASKKGLKVINLAEQRRTCSL